jgi:hypothetical protein
MLKLGQLPDRQPVKLTITLQPDLKKALDDYAALYARTYGAEEPVSELVPYILEGFLKGDTGFRKARKELETGPLALPLPKRKPKTRRSAAETNEEGQP